MHDEISAAVEVCERLDRLGRRVVDLVTGMSIREGRAVQKDDRVADFALEIGQHEDEAGLPKVEVPTWNDLWHDFTIQPFAALYVPLIVTVFLLFVVDGILDGTVTDPTSLFTWITVGAMLLSMIVAEVHVPGDLGSAQLAAVISAIVLFVSWGVTTGASQIAELDTGSTGHLLALGVPVAAVLLTIPLALVAKARRTTGGSTRKWAIPGWICLGFGAIGTYALTGRPGNLITALATFAAAIAAHQAAGSVDGPHHNDDPVDGDDPAPASPSEVSRCEPEPDGHDLPPRHSAAPN